MRQIKRVFIFSACIFIITAFFKCPVPGVNIACAQSESESTGYKVVYSPKLQPDLDTMDAAKNNLAGLLKNRKRPIGIKLYGKPELNKRSNAQELIDLLKGSNEIVIMNYDDNNELMSAKFKDLNVLDDRIEISPLVNVFYNDLPDYNIMVEQCKDSDYPYIIYFRGSISFSFQKKDLADAQKFADDLFFIRQTLQKKHDEQLALFESKVAEYRGLTIKPQVPEEQRKYIVQANALGQKKEYVRAISLYLKAVEVNPVSYPGAYFNLALLSAQMNRFNQAISYMKQYLLLEPEAQDARSAQDKIYEWELMIEK